MGGNIGEFCYLDYLEEKILANSLQIKHIYGKFHNFEGENYGNQPSNRQCFLLPKFSGIWKYIYSLLLAYICTCVNAFIFNCE